MDSSVPGEHGRDISSLHLMRKPKSKYQSITYFKRRVLFDGRGELKCELCGVKEKLATSVRPSKPHEEYTWIKDFNHKVLGFLAKHKECK